MSIKNFGGIVHIGTYNDHHKEATIHVPAGTNPADLIRAFMSDRAEDVTFPSSSGAPDDSSENNSSSNSPGSNPDNPILPIPKEGKYSQVREYIKERSRFDAEFKTFVQDRSLRDLCTRLTDEFGWFVDEHSLGSNLNRHRKD